MRRNSRFRIGLFLALVMSAGVAAGQVIVLGELGGQVKDETGGALLGATVTTVRHERRFPPTPGTHPPGRFPFPEIQPGRYNVTVSLSGFTTVTLTDNLVENQ